MDRAHIFSAHIKSSFPSTLGRQATFANNSKILGRSQYQICKMEKWERKWHRSLRREAGVPLITGTGTHYHINEQEKIYITLKDAHSTNSVVRMH